MNNNERYEVNNEGKLVKGIPQVLDSNIRKEMIASLFNRDGWTYELLEEKNKYHFLIKLVNSNIEEEYILNLYHQNIRKEDPNRSRYEKKIQLGANVDPRGDIENGIVLGFYVYEDKDMLENVVIVSFPIEEEKNYPKNPSLRLNMKDDILLAKNVGFNFRRDRNIISFRPEFIYYFLENYKEMHYGEKSNEEQTIMREDSITYTSDIQLDVKRNRIIFGAPGTGKSYKMMKECNELISGTEGEFERVTFYPDYSYSRFMGTYKPVINDTTGEIEYRFVPGPFMRIYEKALESANSDNPQPFILMIEEINRAKPAMVFGDIFQLLDRDENGASQYSINTSEDIKKYLANRFNKSENEFNTIKLPNNMFIWATMNSADQGVYPMDTAFKRRWNFEYIDIDQNDDDVKCKVILGEGYYAFEVEWNRLRKAINKILVNDYRVNEDKLLGPYFLSKDIIKTVSEEDNSVANQERFKEEFKSKVIMYLYEDAAKQFKYRLFSGCKSENNIGITYSAICKKFDDIGIGIFGEDFKDLYSKIEA